MVEQGFKNSSPVFPGSKAHALTQHQSQRLLLSLQGGAMDHGKRSTCNLTLDQVSPVPLVSGPQLPTCNRWAQILCPASILLNSNCACCIKQINRHRRFLENLMPFWITRPRNRQSLSKRYWRRGLPEGFKEGGDEKQCNLPFQAIQGAPRDQLHPG